MQINKRYNEIIIKFNNDFIIVFSFSNFVFFYFKKKYKYNNCLTVIKIFWLTIWIYNY